MAEYDSLPPQGGIRTGDVAADLEELCRVHDLSLELIERSDDLDELLDLLLDEYERRLSELPADALDDIDANSAGESENPKVRALVMFAAQAAALKARAESASRIRRQAGELEAALLKAREYGNRLRGVMESLDAGIMILDLEGRVTDTNAAAANLIGRSVEDLVGTDAAPYLGGVQRMSNGEVRPESVGDGSRTWLMSRCDLDGGSGEEVVIFGDVTERDREARERHENERMVDVMQAVAVLAHKINNPLTALMGRAQLLKLRIGDDEKMAKAAGVIEESAIRISELIKELASVARDGGGEEMRSVISRLRPKQTGIGEDSE
jgi:signal transduction histidine kinase